MVPTLNAYATALLDVTGFLDNVDVARTVKQINATLQLSCTHIVCSSEPYDYVLPMNVVWLCMDKLSSNYRTFLARTSKSPSGNYKNTWVPVTDINSMWAPQYYDTADLPNASDYKMATVTSQGIVRMTKDPANIGRPTFVSISDPRNTDARNPLPHDEMHAEIPASTLRTASGTVSIDSENAVAGTTLRGTSEIEAKYSKVVNTEVLTGGN